MLCLQLLGDILRISLTAIFNSLNIFLVNFVFSLKMNTPLYGDNFEIKDDSYSDDEETDTEPRIRPADGNAAINAVARIMDGYGTGIPENLLSEFTYVTQRIYILGTLY